MRESNQNDANNPTTLNELLELHPQLTEKAIADYCNALEVVDDHLRFRDQTDDKFLTRILDFFTGTIEKRQQSIDRKLTTGIKIVSVRLEDIELYQAKSDIATARLARATTRLARKLKETRTDVMHLQERHNKLAEDVQATKQRLEQLKIEVQYLSAKDHLNEVSTKWQAKQFMQYPYPPLAGLYLMIDELYWGKFGIYCRKEFGTSEVSQLMQQLDNEVLILMKTYSKDDVSHQLTLPEKWLSPIRNLPKERRKGLSYLSNWAKPETAPVTWAIRNAALLESELPDDFPRVFSVEHAINHLMYENKKRIRSENDY